MIPDLLTSEIKNDIKGAFAKHGLYIGDKYPISILRELVEQYS